jgi:hypothetical protein
MSEEATGLWCEVRPRKDASIASVETLKTLDDVDHAMAINILSIALTCAKYSIFSMATNEQMDISIYHGGLY